jgi:hypothetical protein
MTGKDLTRGGLTSSSRAADRVVLPNPHAAAPASFGGSIARLCSGAAAVATTSSPREAVGEVVAIHAWTNFSDPRRYVLLRHFASPDAVGEHPRTGSSHTSCSARFPRTQVRCDRRQPVPKIVVTMGTYSGAHTW